jgi:hypothetical protein
MSRLSGVPYRCGWFRGRSTGEIRPVRPPADDREFFKLPTTRIVELGRELQM